LIFFGSGVSDESSEENHKYYKTLQDTEHSYQIIQGDLGLKLLLQNLSKQSSVCFDTETTD
jgi:DNA polymerase-1